MTINNTEFSNTLKKWINRTYWWRFMRSKWLCF